MHTSFNYVFFIIGLTAAHHHPDIFHDGDRMRDDPDWGLCQLDAVRDRCSLLLKTLLSVIVKGVATSPTSQAVKMYVSLSYIFHFTCIISQKP